MSYKRKLSSRLAAHDIKTLLISPLFVNIGTFYAGKIISSFGERIFEVLDATPEELDDIRGIGPKRLENIRDGWRKLKRLIRLINHLDRTNKTKGGDSESGVNSEKKGS